MTQQRYYNCRSCLSIKLQTNNQQVFSVAIELLLNLELLCLSQIVFYKSSILQIFYRENSSKMCDQAEMIKYINVARQLPSYFINLIDKQLATFINDKQMPISEDMIYQTNEGKAAWNEAKKFLERQKPLQPLETHEGLHLSAKDHAVDLALHNIFGHTGSDKSSFSQRILKFCKKGQGAMAEIIGADFLLEDRNNAEMTILGLIIDDGVADRGHRKTIFNPQYRYIGCKSEIQNDKVITVFNLTENKLQLRGQSSTLSYDRSRLGASTAVNFLQSKTSQQAESNNHKSESVNFARENRGKQSKQKGVFDELSNIKSSLSPNKFQGMRSEGKGDRKVSEKKENIKIYFEEGSKVTEKYTQLFYSDGTMQENIERHTIYS